MLVSTLVGERSEHSNRLERLFFEVVRFFRIQREYLEGDLRVRHDQRDDGLRAELAHRLKPMVAVRRPNNSPSRLHADLILRLLLMTVMSRLTCGWEGLR